MLKRAVNIVGVSEVNFGVGFDHFGLLLVLFK